MYLNLPVLGTLLITYLSCKQLRVHVALKQGHKFVHESRIGAMSLRYSTNLTVLRHNMASWKNDTKNDTENDTLGRPKVLVHSSIAGYHGSEVSQQPKPGCPI